MIFETSRQAFAIPMLSLGYGIVFATAIILLLIPCLYLVLEDIKATQRAMWCKLLGMRPITGSARTEVDASEYRA